MKTVLVPEAYTESSQKAEAQTEGKMEELLRYLLLEDSLEQELYGSHLQLF